MKKIKTLSLRPSRGTPGGTPVDVIVNGKYVGTIAYDDADGMYDLTMNVLTKNGYDVGLWEIYDLLGIDQGEFDDEFDD